MKQDRGSAGSKIKGLLPPYAWGCLAAMVASQLFAFYITRLLLPHLPSYTLDLPLDAAIPLIPGWVIVYVLAFASWAVSGVVILRQGRRHAFRFAGAYVVAMLLSTVAFLAWPLRLEWPEVAGNGFCEKLLLMVYGADQPNNLCPSLHVLASYFCWRGLWGCPRVPAWFKAFNFVFLILVCFSVVFVKQHLSIDIAGGIIVGEAAIQAARLLRPERIAGLRGDSGE